VRELGILNTSQPYASSQSRDAKFTSEAAERNAYNLRALIVYISCINRTSLSYINCPSRSYFSIN
jgi:hypothetical protein